MPFATGVFKKLSAKRQTALNTIAPAGAAGSARYMRRVTSTLDLAKANYQSAEILNSQQTRDMRHGVRSVSGSISGELSVGGYQQQFESVLRQNVQVAATTGAIITVASASTGTATGTYTRSAGSFIADGFKIGDVVRASGFTTTGVSNNNCNAIITNLTATVMTVRNLDKSQVAAKAAGDSITIALAGKKTWVPQANHTKDYYTIEHWFSDIAVSERFVDSVFTGANIGLPPTGMATVEFPVMGIDMLTGVAEYFTSPANAPTGGILASVNGVLLLNGLAVATITGMSISIAGGHTTVGGVVGSNVEPDIFPGVITVTGQITVLFGEATYRDMFLNETEAAIAVALTADNTPSAGFTSFVMPRVKFGGATKDDSRTQLTLTMPFTALERVDGSTVDLPTTISIQDSAFV